MLRVCNEIGDLAFRFGGFFAIETGSEKAIVLKRFLETANSKGLAVNFDPANIISDVNEKSGRRFITIKKII